MKKYRTLFFDVDQTLLDFSAAEDSALHLLFEQQNIPFTKEIKSDYKKLNHRLWRAFEDGEMDREEVVNTRFSLLFKEYDIDVDGVLLEKQYQSFLEKGHQLIDGAFQLIENLKDQYDLYIVTNGISKTQYKRLHDSGLYPMFKDIFVSEDTGYQKPMKEYFDYVFARVPHFRKDQSLIIGDSLTADIKGGQLAGVDTCWVNPSLKPHHIDIVPTYQIQKPAELYQILDRKADAS
ncbi:YjjG family noncanonical pyrimidine nucleotidase [Bacillus changyiensis]|uniref:YjjG family noncanonical pyrimidine nucleotidase n=1 Tax=Bacillus changyiensis TaxID=3004103 RepID=UPI0022DF69CE|nr:YjjG family noncanonical pyrimidine nucleotidase [Bacillus changyiensis]MDA1478058.1 YjjG family noncanonical pyrimidine nucleotidase [Bacillus changyiensis]